jgi:hypothetical protein
MCHKRCYPLNVPILSLAPPLTPMLLARLASAFSHRAEAVVARQHFSPVMAPPLALGTTLEAACVFLLISVAYIPSSPPLEGLAPADQQVPFSGRIFLSSCHRAHISSVEANPGFESLVVSIGPMARFAIASKYAHFSRSL